MKLWEMVRKVFRRLIGRSEPDFPTSGPLTEEDYNEMYCKGGENPPGPGAVYWRRKSSHQALVEILLKGIGHEIPLKPQLPTNPANILLWGRLCAEELWEYFDAAGIKIKIPARNVAFYDAAGKASLFGETEVKLSDLRFTFNGGSDLRGMADAWGDVLVIATGGLSLCGIPDCALLDEIDLNNNLKLKTGHKCPETGKFLKATDHPKPDIERVLKNQGMT